MSTGAVAAIPIDRSTGLFRWNAVLHFLQFVAILALSFAKNPLVTSPVVGTYSEVALERRRRLRQPARRARHPGAAGIGLRDPRLLPALPHRDRRHDRSRPSALRRGRRARAGARGGQHRPGPVGDPPVSPDLAAGTWAAVWGRPDGASSSSHIVMESLAAFQAEPCASTWYGFVVRLGLLVDSSEVRNLLGPLDPFPAVTSQALADVLLARDVTTE